MLVTICTIRQLPQAFALGDSFSAYAIDTNGQPEPFLIGLADDPAHLPVNFVSAYPLLPIGAMLSPATLAALSASYTPTEFAAACKPMFLAEIFRRYPAVSQLVYADPNVLFCSSLTAIWNQLSTANALLTPHITKQTDDLAWPDEKFFQNVGLYSADFLAFRRSDETDRLLDWWHNRIQSRAYINFCAGLCTDQLWLMHMPVFFQHIQIIKNPGWHVALWNLPERTLHLEAIGWQVTGPTNTRHPLVFFNAKGLFKIDEGFFPYQTRLRLSNRPDMRALLATYKEAVAVHASQALVEILPAYGHQPEPAVLRGWRRATVQSMRAIARFVDQLPLLNIR
ncbi:MAG TPA: hypothetical protein VK404_10545 [Spirosoma sp.]|nr:hypothetical protein [Spirosoma sp.]